MVEQAFQEKVLGELEVLKAMIIGKENTWVPKRILIMLTGLGDKTINTYVSAGKIIKRGTLYSYRSYLEFCEVYRK